MSSCGIRLRPKIEIPNFFVPNRFHFTNYLLLRCLLSVFSSKDLAMTSDTSATRNDVFNVHVLFSCAITIFPYLDV